MTFFDTKQDVMDIQLTRYGKYLLSIGSFKPQYYQFFDDDILYDSSCAGFSEKQNYTHDRITKETPRLKTQSLTISAHQSFIDQTKEIMAGNRGQFQSFKKAALSLESEKILLYPLASQNINTQNAPTFDLRSRGSQIKRVSYSKMTESGVTKNVPILHIEPTYTLSEETADKTEAKMFNAESYVELTGPEIVFRDNSKLKVEGESIYIDLQEINADNALETFKLEIFEVIEGQSGEEVLKKIDKIEEINKYFHIKTDNDVSRSHDLSGKSRGHYKRRTKK